MENCLPDVFGELLNQIETLNRGIARAMKDKYQNFYQKLKESDRNPKQRDCKSKQSNEILRYVFRNQIETLNRGIARMPLLAFSKFSV